MAVYKTEGEKHHVSFMREGEREGKNRLNISIHFEYLHSISCTLSLFPLLTDHSLEACKDTHFFFFFTLRSSINNQQRNKKINSESFQITSPVNLILIAYNRPQGPHFPLHSHINTPAYFDHSKYNKMFLFCTIPNFEITHKPTFFFLSFLEGEGKMVFTIESALRIIHRQKQHKKIFLTERSHSANAK